MLNKLQWSSLAERPAKDKVKTVYKIMNNLVAIPFVPPYFYPATCITTRGHNCKLYVQTPRVDAYKFSFFVSAV